MMRMAVLSLPVRLRQRLYHAGWRVPAHCRTTSAGHCRISRHLFLNAPASQVIKPPARRLAATAPPR
jgi:hypothetical protein